MNERQLNTKETNMKLQEWLNCNDCAVLHRGENGNRHVVDWSVCNDPRGLWDLSDFSVSSSSSGLAWLVRK